MHTHSNELRRGHRPFHINWKLVAGLAAIPASALIMILLPPSASFERQAEAAGTTMGSSGASTSARFVAAHPPAVQSIDHSVVLRPGAQEAFAPSSELSPAYYSN